MTADDERDWWQSADDTDIFGEPPYDVEMVCDIIMAELSKSAHFALGCDVNVLDLGCGVGRLTNAMAARIVGPYTSVFGVDISPNLVARAQALHHPAARYLACDGRNLPDLPLVHAAYSVTMFQHIPREAMWGYIRQVHDLLVPGGSFVFTLAQGNITTFLNHQTRDLVAFGTELALIFDKVKVEHLPDERGWHWVYARKVLA